MSYDNALRDELDQDAEIQLIRAMKEELYRIEIQAAERTAGGIPGREYKTPHTVWTSDHHRKAIHVTIIWVPTVSLSCWCHGRDSVTLREVGLRSGSSPCCHIVDAHAYGYDRLLKVATRLVVEKG